MKKANKMRERPNFRLKPVLRKTAKGGKKRQTSATALLSAKTTPTWGGKCEISGFGAWDAVGRNGPRLLCRIEGENSGEASVDLVISEKRVSEDDSCVSECYKPGE